MQTFSRKVVSHLVKSLVARLWPVEQRMAQQMSQWKKVRPGTVHSTVRVFSAPHVLLFFKVGTKRSRVRHPWEFTPIKVRDLLSPLSHSPGMLSLWYVYHYSLTKYPKCRCYFHPIAHLWNVDFSKLQNGSFPASNVVLQNWFISSLPF